MLSKKSLVGAVIGVVAVATRVGREQIGNLVGAVKGKLGAGGSDPFAVAPSDRDISASTATTAADLTPAERQALAADLPPTPGTVAVAVGAPNAPDLDVIAGDHDLEHRATD